MLHQLYSNHKIMKNIKTRKTSFNTVTWGRGGQVALYKEQYMVLNVGRTRRDEVIQDMGSTMANMHTQSNMQQQKIRSNRGVVQHMLGYRLPIVC